MKNGFRGEHAVVVGAGISGLLSARVLSERFERVTILDRDELPERAGNRKGVPQSRHLHSLAAKGSELLEELFPGLDAELSEAGCPLLDQSLDAITDLPAGRLPRFPSGVTMRAASRALLEWRIRRRVADIPNVRFSGRTEATGLVRGGSRNIKGAFVRNRDDGTGNFIEANLVLDASGNASQAPKWLEDIGYEAPKETVVDARLGYATRWYEIPEGFDANWKSLAVLPGWPRNPRGGSLRRVEGRRWTVVLVGIGGDYPPTGEEEFERFAASLSSPVIYDAIRGATPVSAVYGYRRTANRKRHYEKVSLPENFLVAGDAACVLNPSYGQGMTTAALSAVALREVLGGRRSGRLSRRFQKRQAKAVSPAWMTTTNSDRQWSAASVEELSRPRRILHRVSDEAMRLATEDETTAKTLLAVKNLTASPASLVRPGILLPAISRSLRG
jgi:2-polyprenyl-6-methoxyphenol hydroxylase-like FAD-dependent oxidoreductase